MDSGVSKKHRRHFLKIETETKHLLREPLESPLVIAFNLIRVGWRDRLLQQRNGLLQSLVILVPVHLFSSLFMRRSSGTSNWSSKTGTALSMVFIRTFEVFELATGNHVNGFFSSFFCFFILVVFSKSNHHQRVPIQTQRY